MLKYLNHDEKMLVHVVISVFRSPFIRLTVAVENGEQIRKGMLGKRRHLMKQTKYSMLALSLLISLL